MNKEQELELIEKYLAGTLTEAETEEVKQRAASDPGFEEFLRESTELIGGIRYTTRKETLELLNSFDHKMPEYTIEARVIPLHRRPWVRGIAAAIIILIVSLYYWLSQSATNSELYLAHFEVYPNIVAPTVRSTDTQRSAREAAYFQYEQGNYTEALELLGQLSVDQDDGAALLYMGISQLMLDDYKGAIESFSRYRDTNFDTLLPQVNWYMGLAYLKVNRRKRAKAIWSEIPETSTYYQKVVQVGL